MPPKTTSKSPATSSPSPAGPSSFTPSGVDTDRRGGVGVVKSVRAAVVAPAQGVGSLAAADGVRSSPPWMLSLPASPAAHRRHRRPPGCRSRLPRRAGLLPRRHSECRCRTRRPGSPRPCPRRAGRRCRRVVIAPERVVVAASDQHLDVGEDGVAGQARGTVVPAGYPVIRCSVDRRDHRLGAVGVGNRVGAPAPFEDVCPQQAVKDIVTGAALQAVDAERLDRGRLADERIWVVSGQERRRPSLQRCSRCPHRRSRLRPALRRWACSL